MISDIDLWIPVTNWHQRWRKLHWLDSEFKISTYNKLDDEDMITRISDLKSDFYIDCLSGFILKKGLESEFSFDDPELPELLC